MQPNQILQNYRLIRNIGEGGMGEVWLGQHTHLDRQVAIKCLHPQLLKNDTIRTRFKQEAMVLSKLRHPGIVELYDYFEADGAAFLVMEFVEGMPLDDYIQSKSGPMPEAKLQDFMGQILEAFSYAHNMKIVHRDIKPGNFMVTPEGKIKVLDFGIAKVLDQADRKLTKTGTHMGTVLYMSPEQVKGGQIDQRSDIYSLGVVLFQMATGQCPYDNSMTEFTVYENIVRQPLPRGKEYYPGVTERIQAVVDIATAKAPEQRFQDCWEFLKAMQSAPKVAKQAKKEEVVQPVMAKKTEMATASVSQPQHHQSANPQNETTMAGGGKKVLMWVGIGLIVAVIGVAGLIFIPPLLNKGSNGGGGGLFEPERTTKYVFASGLYMRVAPNEDASKLDKIPYGTEVVTIGDPQNGFYEIEHEGKSGYVSSEFLEDRLEFQKLDRLCANDHARDLLKDSKQKRALLDYFNANGHLVDLEPGDFQEVYPNGSRSDIWVVRGRKVEGSIYNHAIMGMDFEKVHKKGEEKNNVVIIEKKDNPDQRSMLVFKYVKRGEGWQGEYLTGWNLINPRQLIRSVTWEDIDHYTIDGASNDYNIWRNQTRYGDAHAIMNKGLEGILLADPADASEATLILFFNGQAQQYSLVSNLSRLSR